MTQRQWNKMRIKFNENPLTIDEIFNILSDYRVEDEILEHSYEFSQNVMDCLTKTYPTLPYALYHHRFITDFDPVHIDAEWWVGYGPSFLK